MDQGIKLLPYGFPMCTARVNCFLHFSLSPQSSHLFFLYYSVIVCQTVRRPFSFSPRKRIQKEKKKNRVTITQAAPSVIIHHSVHFFSPFFFSFEICFLQCLFHSVFFSSDRPLQTPVLSPSLLVAPHFICSFLSCLCDRAHLFHMRYYGINI